MANLFYDALVQGRNQGVARSSRKALEKRFGLAAALDPEAYSRLATVELNQQSERRKQDLFDRRRVAYEALKGQYGAIAGDPASATTLYNLAAAPAMAEREALVKDREYQYKRDMLTYMQDATRQKREAAARKEQATLPQEQLVEAPDPKVMRALAVEEQRLAAPEAYTAYPGIPRVPPKAPPPAQAPLAPEAPVEAPSAPVSPSVSEVPLQEAAPVEPAADTAVALPEAPEVPEPPVDSQSPKGQRIQSYAQQYRDLIQNDPQFDPATGTLPNEVAQQIETRFLNSADDVYSAFLAVGQAKDPDNYSLQRLAEAYQSDDVKEVAIARALIDSSTRAYPGYGFESAFKDKSGDPAQFRSQVKPIVAELMNIGLQMQALEQETAVNILGATPVTQALQYGSTYPFLRGALRASGSKVADLTAQYHDLIEVLRGTVKLNVGNVKLMDTIAESLFLASPEGASSRDLISRVQSLGPILGLGNIAAQYLPETDYSNFNKQSPELYPSNYSRRMPESFDDLNPDAPGQQEARLLASAERIMQADALSGGVSATPDLTGFDALLSGRASKGDLLTSADGPRKFSYTEVVQAAPQVTELVRNDPDLKGVLDAVFNKPASVGDGATPGGWAAYFTGVSQGLTLGVSTPTIGSLDYLLSNTSDDTLLASIHRQKAEEDQLANTNSLAYLTGLSMGGLALGAMLGLAVATAPVTGTAALVGAGTVGLAYIVRAQLARVLTNLTRSIGGPAATRMVNAAATKAYGSRVGKALTTGLGKAAGSMVGRGTIAVAKAGAVGAAAGASFEAIRGADPSKLTDPGTLGEGAAGGIVGAGIASSVLGAFRKGVNWTSSVWGTFFGDPAKSATANVTKFVEQGLEVTPASQATAFKRALASQATAAPGSKQRMIDFLPKQTLNTIKSSLTGDPTATNAYFTALNQSAQRWKNLLYKRDIPLVKAGSKRTAKSSSLYDLADALGFSDPVTLTTPSGLRQVKDKLQGVFQQFGTDMPVSGAPANIQALRDLTKSNVFNQLTNRKVLSDRDMVAIQKVKDIVETADTWGDLVDIPAVKDPLNAQDLNTIILAMRNVRVKTLSAGAAREAWEVEEKLIDLVSKTTPPIPVSADSAATYRYLNKAFNKISAFESGMTLAETALRPSATSRKSLETIAQGLQAQGAQSHSESFKAGLAIGRDTVITDAVTKQQPELLRKFLTDQGLFKALHPDKATRLADFTKLKRIYTTLEASKLRSALGSAVTPKTEGLKPDVADVTLLKMVAQFLGVKSLISLPFKAAADALTKQSRVRESLVDLLSAPGGAEKLPLALRQSLGGKLSPSQATAVSGIFQKMWRTLKQSLGPRQAVAILKSPALWARATVITRAPGEEEIPAQ